MSLPRARVGGGSAWAGALSGALSGGLPAALLLVLGVLATSPTAGAQTAGGHDTHAVPAAESLVDASEGAAPAGDSAEAEAATLLTRLRERLAARSFAAAATLRVERPGRAPRELLLRIYHAAPDDWLLVADGPVREKGLRVLLADGALHLWFPRAELLLALPPALGGGRLFGSDFALDELLVLSAGPEHWQGAVRGRQAEGGVRRVTLELREREATTAAPSVRLQLDEQDAAPRVLEQLDAQGRVLRRVEMSGRGALPEHWLASRPDTPGARSTLQLVHFDPAPHFDATLFTPQGLRR